MQRILSFVSMVMLSAFVFSSCMKKEKPYVIPPVPDGGEYKIENNQVSIGEDYATQVYFSLSTGVVSTGKYNAWDISFTTGADKPELWMNGGNKILIYPTGNSNYAAVTTLGAIPAAAWKYDNSSGLSGQSGLGILSNDNHAGEVLIVDGGAGVYYKLQILEIAPTYYKIKTGTLAGTEGTEITLEKDENYNYVFYSFTGGIVKPEPPKKDWDLLFTRYRYIYYHYNPDGSDFPYYVNGVLSNPYLTQSGDDSTKAYEFYDFTLDNASAFTLYPDRDVIGFDWKTANINDGSYKVNAKAIFVIKDQQERLWKLHFTGFYDGNGKKGNPSFEFQRLK